MLSSVPLVEVWRGEFLESQHRGHAVVCGSAGEILQAWGNPAQVILPRSSCKILQALPLITSGAADAFGLNTRQLALACASHQGAQIHSDLVQAWVRDLGKTDDDFRCGPQWPRDIPASNMMVKTDQTPCRYHNNCSGKHSGFLATAYHMGETLEGYIAKDHPVQERLLRVLTELGGCDLLNTATGIDGCGIPVMAMPLSALALAAARMSAPDSLGLERAVACKRIISAMMAYPYNVAGQNRFDTNIMAVGKGMFATKTGAEGVHVGMFVKSGYGVAIKCEDGAKRATDVAMANIVNLLGCLDEVGQMCVAQHLRTTLNNAAGLSTGEIRMRVDWRD